MALSLGIKTGAKFKIGNHLMVVLSVGPGSHAVVDVGGKSYHVNDQRSVEVLKDVRISFGPERSTGGYQNGPRLAFEAPITIPIVRL